MAVIETENEDQAAEDAVEPQDAGEGEDDAQDGDETGEPQAGNGDAVAGDPEQGDAAQAMEKKLKKLTVSANTWRRRVGEVLEEDALALVPCELCIPEIPGFHWPAEMMVAETELEDRLIRALQGGPTLDYVASPTLSTCSSCQGLGKVKTGSRVPDNELAICRDCLGYGFTPPPQAGAQVAGGDPVAAVVLSAVEPEAAKPETDLWGSPRYLPDGAENPNYGRAPQYKSGGLP
jgi:hypothetical protein